MGHSSLNVQLHDAIIRNNTENFHHLLRQPGINLNFQNSYGETPLLLSLKQRTNKFIMAMELIKAGCNINIRDNFKYTALHKAVSKHASVNVGLELIKRGMDINAQDHCGHTPLHEAILHGVLQFYPHNLQAVCMLLYYGVDVNIPCRSNMTPLMWAFYRDEREICAMLMDLCDNFSCEDVNGQNALHFATMKRNRLAINMIKAGADVNCVAINGTFPLLNSLRYNNAELFKLIWPKVDYEILLTSSYPFLSAYIDKCNFLQQEWLECLYLMLQSPIARDLVERCTSYREYKKNYFSFLSNLLLSFRYQYVELVDRITIINMCLCLGAEATVSDLVQAKRLFGFNEEFQAFLYVGNGCYGSITPPNCFSYYLGVDDDFSADRVLYIIKNLFAESNDRLLGSVRLAEILFSLERFSLPSHLKEELKDLIKATMNKHSQRKILEKLDASPSFPTLMELSRNKVQIFVKQNFRVEKFYQFYEAVHNLRLPESMKDIVLFKAPLY